MYYLYFVDFVLTKIFRWLKTAFTKFDVDHNGALSLTEVENLLRSLNIDMDSKMLKMLFNVSTFFI